MQNENIYLKRILQLEDENKTLKDNMCILSHWVLNSLAYESLFNCEKNDLSELDVYIEKWKILTSEIKYGTHGDWILKYYDELKNELLLDVLRFNRELNTQYC